MKTKRRHELQTNQLADSLAHGIEVVRPYTRVILGLLLAAVVLACTYAFLAVQSNSKQAQGWGEYFEAMAGDRNAGVRVDRRKLSEATENLAGTPAGEWARIALADTELTEGTNLLFTDKAEGRQQLQQAADNYQAALGEVKEPLLKQRALFGLAQAHEGLADLEAARKDYARLQSEFPESPYAKEAQRRENDLQQPATKQFYDWFATYDPARDAAKLPGQPGLKPDINDSLDAEMKLDPALPAEGPALQTNAQPDVQPDGETQSDAAAADRAVETPAGDADASPATEASDPADSQEPAEKGADENKPADTDASSGASPSNGEK